MRKIMKGLAGCAVVAVVAVVAVALCFVAVTKYRVAQSIEAPYPEITLSTDADVLARGEYLVWNVVGCDRCHLPHDQAVGRAVDARPDLQGGWVMSAPGLGSMEFPNITPHPVHGIGRYEPREVARLLRTGVMPDGTLGMTMAGVIGDMSDDDLQAVVSYIYSRPPVDRAARPSEMSFLYDVLMVWVIGDNVPHIEVADPAPPRGPTVAWGEYLALGPAYCAGCHTPREMSMQMGPLFAGCTMTLDAHEDPGMVMCAPNLTPDPATGHIAGWTEERFVARLQAGRVYPGSNMPWESFAGMSEDDLRAIWAFLRTVEPVVRDTGPTYASADAPR
jgi:mono/diheme cytochrome c family protein